MPREGGRPSEPPALPRHPLPGGLFGGWRAPPPRAGSGARAPGPPRRLLPGAPAAVPETPARGRHPDFGAPGLPAASQACLGPGPGARTAPGKALTLHRAREALALVARVHGRRLGARGWSPAGRGARARGARVYMVQGLFLLFFHHPPQPSFSQLREAGRTDVQRAPLPLPRGRWPGPAAPTWLRGCGSRGKEPANPGARAAGSPRGPDGAQAEGRPRAARDAPPPQPPGLHQPAPCPHPGGLGRRVWHPLPSPHPGSGAFAPAALGIWSPPSPGNRVVPGVCR